MPEYIPLTPERHASLGWTRYTSYAFAASQALLPVVGPELPRAAMCLPIAFVADAAGTFMPVVVLGPEPGVNVFLDANGLWRASYVPAELRSHPFKVAQTPEGQKVLCVDEASGLLVARGTAGAEDFFEEDGKLTPNVRVVVELLEGIEAARGPTLAATRVMAEHGLIQPWTVQLEIDGKTHELAGLHRIEETALNALADEEFLALRSSGCIPLAYSQLLSMQHMSTLQTFANARVSALKARESLVRAGELDLGFMQSDTIRF
jgi:hypothetical protein